MATKMGRIFFFFSNNYVIDYMLYLRIYILYIIFYVLSRLKIYCAYKSCHVLQSLKKKKKLRHIFLSVKLTLQDRCHPPPPLHKFKQEKGAEGYASTF